jgi:hypothetical protein
MRVVGLPMLGELSPGEWWQTRTTRMISVIVLVVR